MRALIQRVTKASVTVGEKKISMIGQGLLVYLGVNTDDEPSDISYTAKKVAGLRIFNDDSGKMQKSVKDIDGEVLVVSEFTLYGDCKKGRRPNFIQAARPEKAKNYYNEFCHLLHEAGIKSVKTGVFGAMMAVTCCNDGPVTLLLQSPSELNK